MKRGGLKGPYEVLVLPTVVEGQHPTLVFRGVQEYGHRKSHIDIIPAFHDSLTLYICLKYVTDIKWCGLSVSTILCLSGPASVDRVLLAGDLIYSFGRVT